MTDRASIFGIHGTALALRSQRLAVLASNIANAGTPGYRARDTDFDAALRSAERGAGSDRAASDALRYRVPLTPSLDGNTVELASEQTAFAENALHYRTSLAIIEGRVATLKRALKGE